MTSINIFSQRNKKQILSKKLVVSIHSGICKSIFRFIQKYNYEYAYNRSYIDDVLEELMIYQDEMRKINNNLVHSMTLENFLYCDYPSSTLDAIEVFSCVSKNNEFDKDINNLFYNNGLPYELENCQVSIVANVRIPKGSSSTMKMLKEEIEGHIVSKEYILIVDRLHTYYGYLLEMFAKLLSVDIENDSKGHIILSLTNKKIAEHLLNNKSITDFEKTVIVYANSIIEKYNSVRNNDTYSHPNKLISNDSAEFIVKIFSATMMLLESCVAKEL